jgi:hypothetical protein
MSRNFRMALWGNETAPAVDADMSFFFQDDTQPASPARSILEFFPFDTKVNVSDMAQAWANMVGRNHYDFSRIDAVIIDEPYLIAAGAAPPYTSGWRNPCNDGYYGIRYQDVLAAYQQFQALAQAVKRTSHATRFWINFSEPEVQWMMDPSCPITLSGPFVDVVSLDKYLKPFAGPCQITINQEAACVQPYYDWLVGHPAYQGQQIALVPGTFVKTDSNNNLLTNPQNQANLLPGFFNYAARMNRSCNLPLGATGVTGIADGCPVWVVNGPKFHRCERFHSCCMARRI